MTIDRRRFFVLATAAGYTAAGLPGTPPRAADVDDCNDPSQSKFAPESLTIKAGDTVTWTNPQIVAHTVTFDPAQAKTAGDAVLPAGVAPFDSGDLQQDQTFKHQFTVKGTYKYFCKYHEDMRMVGTVIVT